VRRTRPARRQIWLACKRLVNRTSLNNPQLGVANVMLYVNTQDLPLNKGDKVVVDARRPLPSDVHAGSHQDEEETDGRST
jgi:hypothetical protein